ncbi:MAG: hypothetical protein ACYTGZ_17935 [Planctomycetota bacterium]
MRPRLVLLLNVAVLIVNFVLVIAASDSQERVLRATTRMACECPALPSPYLRTEAPDSTAADRPERGAIGGAIGQVPHIRLLKYLSRVDGLDSLSGKQLNAVYSALEHCCRALVEAGDRVRRAPTGGAAARRSAEAARERVEQEVADRLRAAEIQDRGLVARLVRVVVSSAG